MCASAYISYIVSKNWPYPPTPSGSSNRQEGRQAGRWVGGQASGWVGRWSGGQGERTVGREGRKADR